MPTMAGMLYFTMSDNKGEVSNSRVLSMLIT
jgi:hypothetical protein